MLGVGSGVGQDCLAGKGRSGFRATRGIADLGGEVSDDEHRLMTEFLKLAQLFEDDTVAKVKVGRSGINPELGSKRCSTFQLFEQLRFAENTGGAAGEDLELLGGRFHGLKKGWPRNMASRL